MQINKLILALILLSSTVVAQDYPVKFTGIEGWTIEGEKQYYSQDNLYDYINGASDFYLGYDFQDLWVVDYKNEAEQMLTLELYRHGNKLKAFGIYSEERPQGVKLQAIGAQGFMEGGAVFFLADDYYVKVYNSRPEVPADEFVAFAKTIANAICSSCELPAEFALFPPKGKVDLSERYMPENFMGLTGFNGVCTVNYSMAGEGFRLFIYKGSDDKCQAIMNKYFERMKYKKKLKAKTYDFNDPYLGKLRITYQKGIIAGIIDSKAPMTHAELLNALLEN
ncbi:hypothetical protein KDU71_20500 [Carboxylicivirga sediminis]|uniref:Uncharacterized protein n=1 Tax=Carboxylicivirga sediminis TaxID=2006564 RepID=A0A941IYJ8_9BACT|nr:DUF6599 family protein [Carboxylicivirga sediminis]MBR8537961.1 hypothetical protein [Carboxylicivirga sediminis]